jgi:hypothetical protein
VLTISTWKWGDKFSVGDVAKLAAGVARNLRQPHRFICLTDDDLSGIGIETARIKDPGLTKQQGCFARLRMFDDVWQRDIGVQAGERIACIDLDTVITGELDPLFDRPEPFVIMQGGNASNPCPFNGALQMLRGGAHQEVWYEFTLERARAVPFYEFPDDQGWLWHKIPKAAGWKCGVESGVFVFHKPGWPGWTNRKHSTLNDTLPNGARLVTFSGWRNPRRFKHLGWIKENWR